MTRVVAHDRCHHWHGSPSRYNIPMLDFGTTASISILFLVDPPGTVPAFISLTARQTPPQRRKTALVASLTATLRKGVRYSFWCAVGSHRSKGMSGSFVAR